MAINAFGDEMSGPAKTIYYFAFYMLLVGSLLMVIPRTPLVVFGLPVEGLAWIRIMGLMVLILATYYITLARNEVTAFFRVSVRMRAAVPFIFLGFAVVGWIEPILVLFGLGDLAGALWTRSALRKADAVPETL